MNFQYSDLAEMKLSTSLSLTVAEPVSEGGIKAETQILVNCDVYVIRSFQLTGN